MKDSVIPRFNSISSSAKSLLLTKALTSIPFAKEAAGLILGDESIKGVREKLSSLGFLLRLIHFETRYLSIDKALTEIGIKNILEFSSGFSFRGLHLSKDPGFFYIDTDLPQLINNKKIIVQELTKMLCNYPSDNLLMRSLNVLDEEAFIEVINHFPDDSVAIVNEGLLIYLDEEQKRKLCTIIHKVLSEREGYWITADIYIKKELENTITKDFFEESETKFLAEHNVEENKFESFEVAESFFKDCGFDIYKKIEVPSSEKSSIKFLKTIPESILRDIKKIKKTRETWILKISQSS